MKLYKLGFHEDCNREKILGLYLYILGPFGLLQLSLHDHFVKQMLQINLKNQLGIQGPLVT
jgi:hypothetical protein